MAKKQRIPYQELPALNRQFINYVESHVGERHRTSDHAEVARGRYRLFPPPQFVPVDLVTFESARYSQDGEQIRDDTILFSHEGVALFGMQHHVSSRSIRNGRFALQKSEQLDKKPDELLIVDRLDMLASLERHDGMQHVGSVDPAVLAGQALRRIGRADFVLVA